MGLHDSCCLYTPMMARSCVRCFSARGRIDKQGAHGDVITYHGMLAMQIKPYGPHGVIPMRPLMKGEGDRSSSTRVVLVQTGASTAPLALCPYPYQSEIVFSDLPHRRYVSAPRKQYSTPVPKQLDYCGPPKDPTQGENACLTRNARQRRPRHQYRRYESRSCAVEETPVYRVALTEAFDLVDIVGFGLDLHVCTASCKAVLAQEHTEYLPSSA
jgi:hypothetical protein